MIDVKARKNVMSFAYARHICVGVLCKSLWHKQ